MILTNGVILTGVDRHETGMLTSFNPKASFTDGQVGIRTGCSQPVKDILTVIIFGPIVNQLSFNS